MGRVGAVGGDGEEFVVMEVLLVNGRVMVDHVLLLADRYVGSCRVVRCDEVGILGSALGRGGWDCVGHGTVGIGREGGIAADGRIAGIVRMIGVHCGEERGMH